MQSQQNSIPPFRAVSSKPMLFLNFIFGLFWVCFVLFFITGIVFLLFSSSEEIGLNVIASVFLFFIFFIALSGIAVLLIYSRKKMSTTTIMDEKGIRYLNKFNNTIVKDLPWSSFVKKDKLEHVFESPKYDVTSITPMKSFFDQFYWPVLIDDKVTVHNDAFLGRHFFVMFYANRLELIRMFLLGVAHYRPDITVDPIVFSNHYIDPKTYIIDYRQQRRIGILGGLFCVIILVVVYYLVF
jgi:heme/copper-type cytochrome/quinol oxidase subunit 4